MSGVLDLHVWQGDGFVGIEVETDDYVLQLGLAPELARNFADMLTRASFGVAQIPSEPIARCERHLRPVDQS